MNVPTEMEKTLRSQLSPIPVKFKGVVPQPNGHYGAQIYANHQQIWLGTFKSEVEAALAYDSACMKLGAGDKNRNFQLTNVTAHEPKFQSLHNTDMILNMIRDGSYQFKFAEFLRSQEGGHELRFNQKWVHGLGGFSCKFLFRKILTPSDVGKLNRLVIPKNFAVRHFPPISENPEENTDENNNEGKVHLLFSDATMKLWKFRFCYWKSSQSYVFTGGWKLFVNDKGLKANDTIVFYVREGQEESKDGKPLWLIDVCPSGVSSVEEVAEQDVSVEVDVKENLCMQLGQTSNSKLVQEVKVRSDGRKFCFELEPADDRKKMVKLFGVNIN